MNFFSFLLIFVCLHFAAFCGGQNNAPGKELSKTEKNHIEKKDTSFQYFIGKHPLPQRHSVYFEFYGSAANLYSLNYERCFFYHKSKSERWTRYSVRIGLNYYEKKAAVPLLLHFSAGREKCFEAGAGWVPWFSDKKRVDGVAVFSGFRLQPYKSGMMARFGLTPTYLVQEKRHWRMIVGISFGFAF